MGKSNNHIRITITGFLRGLLDRSPNLALDDALKGKIARSLVAFIRRDPEQGTEMVRELLDQISSLQEKNKLLEATSLTDPLTGAYNERYFQRTMADLDYQGHAAKRRITGHHYLMMIDLDGFKQINDTYGHEVGNEALRVVVRKLNVMTRKSDAVCRVGGDEFVIVLRDATAEGAFKKIVQITDAFDTMSFQHQGIAVPIRASIGYGEIQPARFIKDILKEIDADLYAAKKIKGESRFAKLIDPIMHGVREDRAPAKTYQEQTS